MSAIELNPMGAFLNEGSAVRVGRTASGAVEGETHVYFDGCEESKTITLPDASCEGTGRILDVNMTLRNVCPARRTAVGVTVHEVDQGGTEYPRGFRAITVPAHNYSTCRDVAISTLRFILPEDLRVDGGTGLCGSTRHFVVRAATHYIDTDASVC